MLSADPAARTTLALVSVPGLTPGETMPPDEVMAPTVPVPPRVAVTLTGLAGWEPFTSSVPPPAVVRPVWMLLPVSVKVPTPPLNNRPPVPEITPA
jgi:hypothetical protein